MSSAFNPESVKEDRENYLLCRAKTLRTFASHSQDDLDHFPFTIELACNSVVLDSTGSAPSVLSYGRHLPAPTDQAVSDEVHATYGFVGAIREAIQNGNHNLVKSQERHL